MKKPVPKFTWVTWILSAATIISIITEIVGAAIHNDTKDTWTELITAYIPWEAQIAIYGALALWLPFHFYRNNKKRQRELETDPQTEKEAAEYLDYIKNTPKRKL